MMREKFDVRLFLLPKNKIDGEIDCMYVWTDRHSAYFTTELCNNIRYYLNKTLCLCTKTFTLKISYKIVALFTENYPS